MKRFIKFAVLFVIALIFVSFLPLFIEQTMTRSQTSGNSGDIIHWSWKIRTFYGFLSDSKFLRPEENFAFYLFVNTVLAFLYSFIIAFFLNRIIKKFSPQK